MKLISKMVICVITLMLSFSTTVIAEAPIYEKGTPEDEIRRFAEIYSVDVNTLLSVAKCESSLNPDAINYDDGGKGKHSVGIFQFQRATFDRYSKEMNMILDYYDYSDQARVASYMFSIKQQRQWTCYTKLYVR